MTREGRVAARDDGEYLSLAGVLRGLVVGGAVHLLDAGGGGGGAGLGPVLGRGGGRVGGLPWTRGLAGPRRPHVLAGAGPGLGVRLGEDGHDGGGPHPAHPQHLAGQGPAGHDHPHHGGSLVLTGARVETVLAGCGVAGREKLLVGVVRLRDPAC